MNEITIQIKFYCNNLEWLHQFRSQFVHKYNKTCYFVKAYKIPNAQIDIVISPSGGTYLFKMLTYHARRHLVDCSCDLLLDYHEVIFWCYICKTFVVDMYSIGYLCFSVCYGSLYLCSDCRLILLWFWSHQDSPMKAIQGIHVGVKYRFLLIQMVV